MYDPGAKTARVFSMKALPFGASRSVYSFLRVAHSLWWLGAVALHFIWSSFFDDFVTLAREGEALALDPAIAQFFKLLGWATSGGDKDLPFDTKFKALGVEVDLGEWRMGKASFRNTAKRVEELVQTIDEILGSGTLSAQLALSLRGRMQFAKSQIWGRAAKICLNAVTSHAHTPPVGPLSDGLIASLKSFRESLRCSPPRTITVHWDTPLFLFTDASFCPTQEDWPCGLGGVLVDQFGAQCSALSMTLSMDDLCVLGFPKKNTVIFEAEVLAIIVCLKLWRRFLRNRPCVIYVDNNSARDIAIAGNARTSPGRELVSILLNVEDSCGLNAWYSRVPSESNIADGPSRNDLADISANVTPTPLVQMVVKKLLSMLVQPDKVG